MFEKVCRACGGALVREGNYFVCEYCQRKELIDASDDIHAVARANAWEALRKSDFEKATELFEELVVKNNGDYDSHWGLALARASIVYVNDVIEGKKVPTLNNVTENSFLGDKNVKTAISLAPTEIAESYKAHAEYVDKVRLEWLETASKEPPYDVFISFKDSDREHGITRTNDSQTMQDLYTALVEKGYKVFYSRVTLKGKVSEQYEPYIYNAIKTAKVMIVYGEKAEYFNSTWIKNEWMRFKKRVESGEKHKNALVTVFKGVDPYEIPTALTGGRQAIDYSIPSNYEVLLNHVKLIVNESKQAKKLEKIEIKGGQMGKKSTQVQTETLKTREIGSSAAQASITDKQTLKLVATYAKAGDFVEAEKLLGELLYKNPNNPEYKWQRLLLLHKTTESAISAKVPSFTASEIDLIKDILATADKKLATTLLNVLYDGARQCKQDKCLQILNIILPYSYDDRDEKIASAFDSAFAKRQFEVFKLLLTTLPSDSVDEYVECIIHYAQNVTDGAVIDWAVSKIFEVDESNPWALEVQFKKAFELGDLEKSISAYETFLKYSNSVDAEIEKTLENLSKSITREVDCAFIWQILRYYGGDMSKIIRLLTDTAFSEIRVGRFDFAQQLLELVISKNPDEAEAYWGLCLVALKVKSETQILQSEIELKHLPEFKKHLTLIDENRQMQRIELSRRQEMMIAERNKKKNQAQQERLKREKREKAQAQAQAEAEARKKKTRKLIGTVVAIIVGIAVCFGAIVGISTAVDHNARNGLNLQLSSTNDYYVVAKQSVEDENLQSVVIPSEYKGLPVKEITTSAFSNCQNLTSVEIPNSVTSIGDYAFAGCTRLTGIEIPDSVTSIGDWAFSNCSSLTSITIPDSVTSIGGYAFSNCGSLTGIEIPDSATSIGENAFRNCSSLTSITIPDSITSIGYYAFYSCSNLKSVYYKGTANDWAKISMDSFGNYDLTSATRYYYSENEPTESDKYWHYDEDGQIEIYHTHTYTTLNFDSANHWYECVCGDRSNSIPHTYNIEYDDTNHWHECDCGGKNNLTPHFGGTATYTEKAICEVCYQIYGDYVVEPFTEGLYFSLQNDNSYAVTDYTGTATEVKIPSTYKGLYVNSIGGSAFEGCNSLTSVVIPDSVTAIGGVAFDKCSSLTSVEIGDSVTSIGDWAFSNCSSLTSITIPNSVTSIGDYAFYWCSSLTSITISDSVTSIGISAFAYCSGLTSIVIPDSVTTIGEKAFDGCNNLQEITLPFVGSDKDGSISTQLGYIFGESTYGYYADFVPSSLKKVVITSATKIGDSAFENCSGLTSIEIPNSVTTISQGAFNGCSSLESITIPFVGGSRKTASDTYQYPLGYIFGTGSYTGGTATTQHYYVYTNSMENTTYYIPTCLKSVMVTGGEILCGAFFDCNSLTSVVIGDSVTSIGVWSFRNCDSLTSVIIGDGVTTIGQEAFFDCNSLTSVVIGNGVTSIGERAFFDCNSLTSVVIGNSVTSIGEYAFYGCSSLISAVIPDGVISIGERTFYGCGSLTSVVIGDSVTSIGLQAFYDCTSLTSIKYRGTQAQWNAISKGYDWNYNAGSYTITYNYNN